MKMIDAWLEARDVVEQNVDLKYDPYLGLIPGLVQAILNVEEALAGGEDAVSVLEMIRKAKNYDDGI